MGVSTIDDQDQHRGSFSFPKNLSVWWNEETEYVLQRIERWAAYARGYNRLRPVRLSTGRMTMNDTIYEEEQSLRRWSSSLQPATGAANERARLRCCGYDYRSNGNLDRNCLETYSLDHSIYFKTIGDIKSESSSSSSNSNNKNNNNNNAKNRKYSFGEEEEPVRTPLDCGDFLASDFDDDGEDDVGTDEELREFDAVDYVLREQLEQLAAEGDEELLSSRPGKVIQICRSVIDEDEINNNVRRLSWASAKKSAAVLHLQATQKQ